MKMIGLLGGMSWESTAVYYRLVNEYVKQSLGGLHSARCLVYSVDFAEIEALQATGAWDEAGLRLSQAARMLEQAGADVIVVCTNTMHKVAAAIEAAVNVPLLHIADPTGEALVAGGFQKVGLLATRFTMEQDFYKGYLAKQYGLEVLVPPPVQQAVVHRVIYEELCLGVINPESRSAYRAIMADLVAAGAEAIILGCTEIELLIGPDDVPVPSFDTTDLHARAAVQYAIGEKGSQLG